MAPLGYRRWTDDDDRRLLEMRAAGKTFKKIAKDLKRTEAAVRVYLSRVLAYFNPKWPIMNFAVACFDFGERVCCLVLKEGMKGRYLTHER
jgi:hypothetical protein